MSADNRSLHQRIKKFSKYLTSKVKETTHNILYEDLQDTRLELEQGKDIVIRRHSSYIQSSIERNPIVVKQGKIRTVGYNEYSLFTDFHTMPAPVITSALSPPPRQSKPKKPTHSIKTTTQHLNSSNTLGNQFDSSSSFTSSPCSSSASTL
jgi:hypothetical protein